jgi:GNAT superfamily N-acetyltransferase
MTTIRPMRAADVPRVAALTTELGYPSTTEEIERRFTAVSARPEGVVLVATDGEDEAIGWIHVLRVASLEASDVAMVAGLVIGERHRSAGIGADLLAAGEAWSRKHGARTMAVRSRSTRPRAHRFYERHGYVQIKLSHVFEKPLV